MLKTHQDAPRLLLPLAVVDPYAERLTFADERTTTRRDHVKYLTLIQAIALLHQHERPRKTAAVAGRQVDYVEVALADVTLANRLARRILGRSLDELPPGARRLLDRVHDFVSAAADGRARERVRFSRRALREATGLGDTQLKVHLARLVSLELLYAPRGPAGTFLYELAWDGERANDEPFLASLADPATFVSDVERSGREGERSGAGRRSVGARSEAGRRPSTLS